MNAIGILDSGLGGYTVFHALHHAFPEASFVFLADQANAPFGDKTRDEIKTIAVNAIAWFEAQGIQEVIVACNTISAQVLSEIIPLFPEMILTGIIDLTADQAAIRKAHRITVLATTGTTRAQAYPQAIQRLNPTAKVNSIAVPHWVPLIEGLASEEALQASVDEVMRTIETDVLVLGCTHYPLIQPQIQRVFHGVIVDSIDPIVDRLANRNLPIGPCRVYTTKDPDFLRHQIAVLFGSEVNVELTEVKHANRLGQ
jgi:glutamate racemase